MQISPLTEEFVRANSSEGWRSDVADWEDRQLVIRKYLALEALLADTVMAWLVRANPKIDPNCAREELLVEGPLGSAPKMTLFLFHAGVIDRAVADDIRSLCKLRHRYAHDHGRGQLKDEPDLMKFLQNTNAFKQARALFSNTDEQGILVCLFAKFFSHLSEVKASLSPAL